MARRSAKNKNAKSGGFFKTVLFLVFIFLLMGAGFFATENIAPPKKLIVQPVEAPGLGG